LNNWKTANGDKVKDKKRWKLLWKLLNNKHIELKWVKSHTENAENKLCDFHSRRMAKRNHN
jgi:ribonuclease HI